MEKKLKVRQMEGDVSDLNISCFRVMLNYFDLCFTEGAKRVDHWQMGGLVARDLENEKTVPLLEGGHSRDFKRKALREVLPSVLRKRSPV